MLKNMNVVPVASESSRDMLPPTSWAQGETPHGTSWTTTVDGVLRGADEDSLWVAAHAETLAVPGDRVGKRDVEVPHDLPLSVRLTQLVGKPVRITTVDDGQVLGAESAGRTMTVSDTSGRVWLVARTGTVSGCSHALCGASGESPSVLHAALSQRPAGPLVIGTAELQWLVTEGVPATLPMSDGSSYCVLLAARRPNGTASYVIADASLFAADWS